jgi:hypothetical protein
MNIGFKIGAYLVKDIGSEACFVHETLRKGLVKTYAMILFMEKKP